MANIIPSVNLNDFTSDDAKRKNDFVQAIGKAYQEIGFVALKGHFLEEILVNQLYQECESFFGLPLKTKVKYEIEGIGGQRGYTGFGKESAKGRTEGDLKEFWHFGQNISEDSKYKEIYPKNVMVEELPEFNKVGQEVYEKLEKTGIYVLRALALFVGLEEFYFDKYIKEGNSILRPIHYPPITEEPKEAVRAAAHTDINLITLLMGAQGKGLQVQNHHGDWIDAIAQPDELMINVGDMLSRHTNNKLKSTVHQVTNPLKESWGSSRYSVPFFMHPVSDMKLDCLAACVDQENPKQFDDITAGEFLTERLRELGLI
ncbi:MULTISPECIES: isopenicillin N synthase family oxygenase [unclassified Lentimicrobium]|uniref:isopenicillin N synthase family dioxygenase n=1 Tax=unclassified Lentimicrobium TaxID=2677434 RepID=UPI0015572812|nr:MULTISPECIES: isopenicillin N synthase family oxygenase [unclassified Lentimicrobium]NPD44563.1 isopenicillin N synthase family oxygenase [Lentimicrobium sp. S6]NPD83274.1 isopenicillin N synthase family oxygenase [Lentimicrobium sp. L6]